MDSSSPIECPSHRAAPWSPAVIGPHAVILLRFHFHLNPNRPPPFASSSPPPAPPPTPVPVLRSILNRTIIVESHGDPGVPPLFNSTPILILPTRWYQIRSRDSAHYHPDSHYHFGSYSECNSSSSRILLSPLPIVPPPRRLKSTPICDEGAPSSAPLLFLIEVIIVDEPCSRS